MSATANRLPYDQALLLAEQARDILAPVCVRLEVAGSIRRRKPDCGDVELVCIPRIDREATGVDLFGLEIIADVNRLDCEVDRLIGTSADWHPRLNINGQRSIGSAMKLLTFRGFALDLFVCEAATWGVTFTIRTGSADFSHRLVTPTTQGGLCPSYLQFKGWRVRRRDGSDVLDTPEEVDVFRVLGLDWIAPEARS